MKRLVALGMASLMALAGLSVQASAASVAGTAGGPSAETQRIIDFWTPDRVAQAVPRDLLLDPRGLAYVRLPSGVLQPYGHSTPAAQPTPMIAGNTTISSLTPAADATLGSTATFSARVQDPDGVKAVSFQIQKSGQTVQSFSASRTSGTSADGTWSLNLQGFSDGSWQWRVTAKDASKGGGYTTTTAWVAFSVSTGSSPVSGGTVSEAQWTAGGDVQQAAGRIFFQMPSNSTLTKWSYYVCSGTAVQDSVSGQSLILTAAHCVYDDVYKVFARNVLFIPNQSGTTASGSDLTCSNDPIGCWAANYGVVNTGWTSRTFPDNMAWDFGYYVVADTGKYTSGITTAPEALQDAVPELAVSFSTPSNTTTFALGYSYSKDPSFRYCTDTLSTNGAVNWWLASCGMTGGSSGGPWMQSSTGAGPIISVNSWGYTGSPGMAGAKFSGSKAECTYNFANTGQASMTPTTRGYTTSC